MITISRAYLRHTKNNNIIIIIWNFFSFSDNVRLPPNFNFQEKILALGLAWALGLH